MEMLKQRLAINLVHVPYKSTSAGLNDLVGGHVDCMLIGIGPAMPHLGEKLNVLAIAGARRNPLVPDAPALAETHPGLNFSTWFGVFAPAETPGEVIEVASRDITQAIQSAAVKAPLVEQGITPTGGTPAQLDAIVQKDFAEYSRLIREAKIDLTT